MKGYRKKTESKEPTIAFGCVWDDIYQGSRRTGGYTEFGLTFYLKRSAWITDSRHKLDKALAAEIVESFLTVVSSYCLPKMHQLLSEFDLLLIGKINEQFYYLLVLKVDLTIHT